MVTFIKISKDFMNGTQFVGRNTNDRVNDLTLKTRRTKPEDRLKISWKETGNIIKKAMSEYGRY